MLSYSSMERPTALARRTPAYHALLEAFGRGMFASISPWPHLFKVFKTWPLYATSEMARMEDPTPTCRRRPEIFTRSRVDLARFCDD